MKDLIVTYVIYRVGMVLFWPLVIIVGLLLFHPVGWLIIGVVWFLGLAYKGIEAEVAEEDANARDAEPETPPATSV